MPRLKKSEAQRRAERFDDHYRTSKAHLKLKEPQIADALGLGVSTLRKYKRNPDLFSMGQLVTMGRIFEWPGDTYLDIFGATK